MNRFWKALILATSMTVFVSFAIGATSPNSYNKFRLLVEDFMTVGSVATRAAKVRITGSKDETTLLVEASSAQTADVISCENISGAQTVHIAAGGGLFLAGFATDPCSADGSTDVAAGGMFRNTTDGIGCECNDGGTDVKLSDPSTGCF